MCLFLHWGLPVHQHPRLHPQRAFLIGLHWSVPIDCKLVNLPIVALFLFLFLLCLLFIQLFIYLFLFKHSTGSFRLGGLSFLFLLFVLVGCGLVFISYCLSCPDSFLFISEAGAVNPRWVSISLHGGEWPWTSDSPASTPSAGMACLHIFLEVAQLRWRN